MTTKPVNDVRGYLQKLQKLVDLEVEAVKAILDKQISQTPKDRETINILLNSFLEQNTWVIGRLRGGLTLATMIKEVREEPGARNQQSHQSKEILFRAEPQDRILQANKDW